ncbi:MAG: hypothetical protein J5657_02900 [Clostridiales bacterium]|nr:hypothetical protein [Clostridiales bacterium]
MKSIDIRLKSEEVSILHSMIGKELTACLHDEFQYTQSSSQVVEIIVGDKIYFIYSFTEALDYFGTPEDVAVWNVSDEKLPIIDKKAFVRTPVNETINGITLIQENQRVFKNDVQVYDVWLTRGIVFDIGERQIAFEKDIWFSEEIIVHRGYDLADHFSSENRFGSDWDDEVRTECCRVKQPIA